MGQLIVSTHVTLDGVIGPAPHEWARLDGEHERHSFDQLRAADAFVLGRKTFEGLAGVWPGITDDSGFAERVNALPKHVASRTRSGPLDWNGTLIEGDLGPAVTRLKESHRGNLLSYGCGELAHALVTAGVVDAVHLWVQPVVWGEGERLFGGRRVDLDLVASTTFSSGVVLLAHRPTGRSG